MDNVTTSSILDLLFGFDLSCKEGEECRPPNIGTMLHAVGNYTWDSKQDVRGIKTDMFKAKWSIAEFNAVVEVRYYWSDRNIWTGTSGTHRSVPVRFEMGGEFVDPLTNETKWIDESIDFMSFLEVKIVSLVLCWLGNNTRSRSSQDERFSSLPRTCSVRGERLRILCPRFLCITCTARSSSSTLNTRMETSTR